LDQAWNDADVELSDARIAELRGAIVPEAFLGGVLSPDAIVVRSLAVALGSRVGLRAQSSCRFQPDGRSFIPARVLHRAVIAVVGDEAYAAADACAMARLFAGEA
jgi:hypothetical protein